MPRIDRLDPLRPVNWRWERARRIVEETLPLSRFHDDRRVRSAVGLRRALRAADASGSTDDARMRRHAHVYQAYQIHENASNQAKMLRAEIEARVLAGQSAELIGELVVADPRLIEAYEALFFDARPYLNHRSYIVRQAIGPAVHAHINASDYPLLWRLFGYFAGPLVLDTLINAWSGVAKPTRASDVPGFTADLVSAEVSRAALIAVKTYNISTFTAPQILELFAKLRQIAEENGAREILGNELARRIGSLLEVVSESWTVCEPQLFEVDGETRSLPAPAAEPTLSETMRAHFQGGDPLPADVADLTFAAAVSE